MTDPLRKAAEMAFEALDAYSWEQVDAARTALRQALSQTEPTVEDNSQQWKGMDGAVAWHLIDRHADNWADVGKMMDEWLKANQALAQPEQEPVKCMYPYCETASGCDGPCSKPLTTPVDAVNMSQERVDETAKHEPEPVGYVTNSGASAYILVGVDLDDDTPIYAEPPKRKWVGLTGEEVKRCYESENPVEAAEDKLKEKNA